MGVFTVSLTDEVGFIWTVRIKGAIGDYYTPIPLKEYSILGFTGCTAEDIGNNVIRVVTPNVDVGGREYYMWFYGSEGSFIQKTNGATLNGTAIVRIDNV